MMEVEKAWTENAQNWVQVKPLMRFMKHQQAGQATNDAHTCSGETAGPVPHIHRALLA